MEAMRERAVCSGQDGESPQVVARVIGISRSSIYEAGPVLASGGWEAPKAKPLFGRPPKLDGKKLEWIYRHRDPKEPIAAPVCLCLVDARSGGFNAGVFIAFLRRLMIGSKNRIFLIVDRGPAHIAKKNQGSAHHSLVRSARGSKFGCRCAKAPVRCRWKWELTLSDARQVRYSFSHKSYEMVIE
jgi:hypothetical protein